METTFAIPMRLLRVLMQSYLPRRVRHRIIYSLIPIVRLYIRFAPFLRSKRSFVSAWTRTIDPHFALGSREFVASTVFGKQIAGDTGDLIERYVYNFGVWEPNLTHWIEERLAPGDTFVDVGAHIGYYSLLASTLVGESGAVIAIEASPRIFSTLQNNLARNRAQNIRPVNMAASDTQGVIKLFRGPKENTGATTILKEGLELECEVVTAPLGEILMPEEIRSARLVKIDVEGAELSVVAGMGSLLSSGRADLEIIVEIHPLHLAQQGKRVEDLMKTFSDADFNSYVLENDYSPLCHLPPYSNKRPLRIRAPIQDHAILVFSREDSEAL